MSGLFGLPANVLAGMATGASASFFTLVELPSGSPISKTLFGSRTRAVITSTGGSLLIGFFVNPLAGVCFEMFFYPACWFKSRQVRKTLEKLRREEAPGSVHEILHAGEWCEVRIPDLPLTPSEIAALYERT